MPRLVRILGPATVLGVALVALFVGMTIGGGASSVLIQDAGPVVRNGIPVAKLLVNLGTAGTLGALLLTLFVFSPKSPEYNRALDVASGSAALLTVASAATAFLIFLDVTAKSVSFDDAFGAVLGQFLVEVELGRAWLTTTLTAAVVTVLCFAVRNQTALFFVGLLALFSLVPIAQQGHAAGTANHDSAITALGLHLVFAAVWLGGLVTLAILSRQLDNSRLVTAMSRYSSIALIAFVVVAASGYVSAEIRVGTLERLTTPYGILVVIKVAALIALGILGAYYRRGLITKLADTAKRAIFWRIVVVELAFMGVASGVAAALGRTATPVPEELTPDPTPAEILTGEPLPDPLEGLKYITEWRFDILWALLIAFGIFFYVAAVIRLRRRGDSWPWYRTVLWIGGMLGLFYITNGALNAYEMYLFSAHMMGHMALSMMVPLMLVPAAPITLALRAIKKRKDGSRGGREWILLAVHSRFGTFIANPIVAALLFASSLVVFYYTPLFRWSMVDHIGHEWMIAHFLIVGYLFVQALIGVDPVPFRLSYPLRLVVLLATMAFHAFFGLAIMSGTGLLLADWYGALGWGTDALADQQLGGGIAWSIGEVPTVILAIVVAISWSRSDKKETTRRDRNADRTGEAELAEYNAMLEGLKARDQRQR